MTDTYDVVVIGAGPGGYVCAIRAAQLGLKTACVEMEPTLGGTCLNVGCIPSKALLESSHHFERANHDFEDHGIMVDKVKLDLKKMLKRKDTIVSGMTGGVEFLFKKNKITWLKGRGKIKAPGTVEITDSKGASSTVSSKNIVIATGSTPIEIPSAPFDHKNIVNSTDALSFAKVPKSLIVIGGGVIGLELGSVWARLGSKVTVVEAAPKLLGATDKNISQAMQKILTKQGFTIHLNTMLKSTKVEGTKVKVTCEQDGKTVELEGNKVLVAVGRKAATANIGLEDLGINAERGVIQVDAQYRTNIPGVYAIGDATPGPMLAHKAEEEGVACAEIIATGHGHVNYDAVPGVVYTWPEIATVGLSEEQCKEKGMKVNIGKFYFKANGRAKAMGDDDGFVKIIADKQTDKLLGFHIIGPNASEMIAEAALAFEYGASAEDIARSVHAHPTLAEVMKEAALDVAKRALHN